MTFEVDAVSTRSARGVPLVDVSLTVADGAAIAIVGANGSGRTSLLNCLAGRVPLTAGELRWDGRPATGWSTERFARHGVVLVPAGRELFADLTVEEHLLVGLAGTSARGARERRRRVEDVYDALPSLRPLRSRRGGLLSGGEQQLVAIGRALVRRPRLMLLDEPAAGLAPAAASMVFGVIAELRRTATAIVLADQNVDRALGVADCGCVMSRGRLGPLLGAAQLRVDTSLHAWASGAERDGAGGSLSSHARDHPDRTRSLKEAP